MKIWNSHGAEHSLKLVIVGRFKNVGEAEEFEKMVQSLEEFINNQSEFTIESDRFSKNVSDYLINKNLYCISPQQLAHLFYESYIERDGVEVKVSTDDDLNGFASLMIHSGARVEMYSTHDYPDIDPKEK